MSKIKFKKPNRPDTYECLALFKEFLRKSDQFTENEINTIVSGFEYFQIGKNTPIIEPGQVCHYIYFVCTGAVKHVIRDSTGQYIIDFMTDGHYCTQLNSFLNERPARDTLYCVKPTFGVRISLPNFRQLSLNVPAFAEYFRLVGEDELNRVINRLKSFQATDARGRYELLMQQNSSVFNLFTMLDIANYLGIKPETLSRLRNEK